MITLQNLLKTKLEGPNFLKIVKYKNIQTMPIHLTGFLCWCDILLLSFWAILLTKIYIFCKWMSELDLFLFHDQWFHCIVPQKSVMIWYNQRYLLERLSCSFKYNINRCHICLNVIETDTSCMIHSKTFKTTYKFHCSLKEFTYSLRFQLFQFWPNSSCSWTYGT